DYTRRAGPSPPQATRSGGSRRSWTSALLIAAWFCGPRRQGASSARSRLRKGTSGSCLPPPTASCSRACACVTKEAAVIVLIDVATGKSRRADFLPRGARELLFDAGGQLMVRVGDKGEDEFAAWDLTEGRAVGRWPLWDVERPKF